LIFAILVFLNLFWVFPFAVSDSLTQNQILSRGLIGDNSHLNVLHAFALSHPYWNGSEPTWFHSRSIALRFWFIPLAVFGGWWLNRKNKNILFFALVAVLGIFLTKQEAEPLQDFYGWLFRHFPGFNAFRGASKFYFLVALGYGVLIGAFVGALWRRAESVKVHKVYQVLKWKFEDYKMAYLLAIFISGLFLWNVRPMITGKIGSTFVPKIIPQDDLVMKDLILNGQEFSRILWLPSDPEFSFYNNLHPKLNMTELGRDAWRDFEDQTKSIEGSDGKDKIINTLEQSFFSHVLDTASIRYVATKDDDFEGGLGKLENLKRVPVEAGEYVVYENPTFRPHIYLTERRETVHRDIPFSKVDFQAQNPSEYAIQIRNIHGPVYLNFSDAFHSSWKIRAGEFRWYKALGEEDYFLSDKNHFTNDAKLNSFYLDPKEICGTSSSSSESSLVPKSENPCRVNENGGYDINLTLYFKPQSWFYLGLIISGITLVLCLIYLFCDIIKKNPKSKH
jgi:hypothetical protein